jgi:CTP:molybdopterin cytidylyltransferase MocA
VRLPSLEVNKPERFAAIVLAAGMSRRMGRHKPLLPIGDRAMIAHVVDRFPLAGVDSVYVVTGFESANVMAALGSRDVVEVHNANHRDGGMLSSVQCAVRAARDCEAFFLSLGDQPFISPDTLREMMSAFASPEASIVLPSYRGKHGHPILIDSAFADEILSLEPDQTLNDFIKRHTDGTREIDVDDPAVVEDIDTPDDYARVLARKGELCPEPTPAAE